MILASQEEHPLETSQGFLAEFIREVPRFLWGEVPGIFGGKNEGLEMTIITGEVYARASQKACE